MAIGRVLYTIYAYIVGVPIFLMFNLTTAPVIYFSDEQNKAYLVVAKFWSTLLTRVLLLCVKIDGLENVAAAPPGSMLICNHQSLMDIPLLLQAWPRPYSYMFKKELERLPIFGWHVRQSAHFCIDRERGESLTRLENDIKEHLRKGNDLAVFAEGTRSTTGSLQALKRGAFHLAIKFQTPVIPVYIANSGRFKPKHRSTAWPQKIGIAIHPAIVPPAISDTDPGFRQATIDLLKQVEAILKDDELRMSA